MALLKEGLPYDLFSRLDDEHVLVYYNVAMWMKEREADALRDAQR